MQYYLVNKNVRKTNKFYIFKVIDLKANKIEDFKNFEFINVVSLPYGRADSLVTFRQQLTLKNKLSS